MSEVNFEQSWIKKIVDRPVTVFMFTLGFIVFGYVSYNRLAINLMPDISYPSITVRTEYDGSPNDLEELIAKPLEQALGITSNLRSIASISKADVCDIVMEFAWGTDMDEVAQSIREKLGRVRLPNSASNPLILRYDPSLDPILRIGIHGHKNEFFMRRIAEDEIERKLESLPGVAAVKIQGGLEKEVWIETNEKMLTKYKIDVLHILNRLREENLNVASGRIKEGETEYFVRIMNQFKKLEEIENLVVLKLQKQIIKIKDIAKVIMRHKEREVITRINGNISVEIAIYKEGDANIVNVAETVKYALFGPTGSKSKYFLANKLPENMKLRILSDQSVFIKKAINEVKNTAITGSFLAIFILFIFLKKLSSTLIISISIPISIIVTFAPMYIYGVSLNIMSMGGLALGVGMLVDTSIVVLESIFRKREEGYDIITSTVLGTSEVSGAVIASTLTTVAVFFPIVFVEGIAGQIFKDQALTVVFSLMASLIVSLLVIPMLATREFTFRETEKIHWFRFYCLQEVRKNFEERSFLKTFFLFPFTLLRFFLFLAAEILGKCFLLGLFLFFWIGNRAFRTLRYILTPVAKSVFFFADTSLEWFYSVYKKVLIFALDYKMTIIVPVVVLFIISLLLIGSLGQELIPQVSQGEFTIEVTLPVGTFLEKTNAILEPLEQSVAKEKEVAMVSSMMGTPIDSSEIEEGEHVGKILVRLKPQDIKNEKRVTRKLSKYFRKQPGFNDVRINYPVLFTFKTPIEIEIKGYNLQALKKVSYEIVQKLKKLSYFENVKSTVKTGNPELQIIYNRDTLARYDLNIGDLSKRLKGLLGDVSTQYVMKDKNIDILVRVKNIDTMSAEQLENIIITPTRYKKKLKDLARVVRVEGFSEIRHINQQRAAIVTADIKEVSLSQAVKILKENLGEVKRPRDFQIVFSGQNKEMEISLTSLKFALFLSIFLVYMVMASQFESLLHPFIIIITLPLAFIGVVITLFLLNISLSIVVYIGIILLTGIVVNNAIVLIDCINQLVRSGIETRLAITKAANLRLRPILMTTLTTILGLLPMAGILSFGGGEGQEIRAPMAITVIAGLISSTILTLIVIPVVYELVEQMKDFFKASTLHKIAPCHIIKSVENEAKNTIRNKYYNL